MAEKKDNLGHLIQPPAGAGASGPPSWADYENRYKAYRMGIYTPTYTDKIYWDLFGWDTSLPPPPASMHKPENPPRNVSKTQSDPSTQPPPPQVAPATTKVPAGAVQPSIDTNEFLRQYMEKNAWQPSNIVARLIAKHIYGHDYAAPEWSKAFPEYTEYQQNPNYKVYPNWIQSMIAAERMGPGGVPYQPPPPQIGGTFYTIPNLNDPFFQWVPDNPAVGDNTRIWRK